MWILYVPCKVCGKIPLSGFLGGWNSFLCSKCREVYEEGLKNVTKI